MEEVGTLRRRLVPAMLTLLALLAVGGAASWLMSGRLVAPALTRVQRPDDRLPVRDVVLDSASGNAIAGWYAAASGAEATVILAHPIRSNRRAMWGRAQVLYDAGYAAAPGSLLIFSDGDANPGS